MVSVREKLHKFGVRGGVGKQSRIGDKSVVYKNTDPGIVLLGLPILV